MGILPEDSFLLCSDGLTDLLTDPEMLEILNRTDLMTAADSLISAAIEAGGTDNVTVLLITP